VGTGLRKLDTDWTAGQVIGGAIDVHLLLTARRPGTTSHAPQRHGARVDLTTSAVANLTHDQPRRPERGEVDYRIGSESHHRTVDDDPRVTFAPPPRRRSLPPPEKRGLQLTKVHQLLGRWGKCVPCNSLHRFGMKHCGLADGAVTVRSAESKPGEVAEIDFGRRGQARRRMLWALVLLVSGRHQYVHATFSQRLSEMIDGLEDAWLWGRDSASGGRQFRRGRDQGGSIRSHLPAHMQRVRGVSRFVIDTAPVRQVASRTR
jgi:hypothetical protein